MKTQLIALALTSVLFSAGAQAAVSGKIEAKLVIDNGCEVTNGSTVDGNINDFGTLDFGKAAPTWVNVLGAELVGSGTGGKLEVTCSPGVTSFNVAIDGGLRGSRTLLRDSGAAGTAADQVDYKVFRDGVRTVEYPIDTPVAFAVPADGSAVQVPVYGSIAPNSAAKTAGTFTDTLLVNITF
ncbi:Csu type fimbrial protein [Lysobacter enzymogenes]|uniref:Csu type fimbrial protein n=1 Tax=Lysobacter enzymogenes TaxID=69 RepID=UPI00099BDE90|nr:spore coat protein U domain-containing protein [Lysobacter enzymogenes]UZW62198.1 spore coat U domain-containing protein [Lysobacter enzymogenes]